MIFQPTPKNLGVSKKFQEKKIEEKEIEKLIPNQKEK